jgi:hypothetical protein
MTGRLSRRALVKLLLLSALAPHPACIRRPRPDLALPSGLDAILAALGVKSESSRVVGRAHLRLSPAALEASRELARTILAAHRSEASRGPAAIAGLKQMLRTRIREDFASGSTVWLHGWLLSRTEAALCSLAVLSDREGGGVRVA